MIVDNDSDNIYLSEIEKRKRYEKSLLSYCEKAKEIPLLMGDDFCFRFSDFKDELLSLTYIYLYHKDKIITVMVTEGCVDINNLTYTEELLNDDFDELDMMCFEEHYFMIKEKMMRFKNLDDLKSLLYMQLKGIADEYKTPSLNKELFDDLLLFKE